MDPSTTVSVRPRSFARALLVAAVLASTSAGAADPFYEGLLGDGIRMQARGEDPVRAARLLRTACFGFLDEPPSLARCLGHLAAAQATISDPELATTLGRLIEIEERFRAYSDSTLSSTLRRRIEELLVAEIPAEDLRRVPAFRHLAARPDEAATTLVETAPSDSTADAGAAATELDLPPEVADRIREIRRSLPAATSRDALLETLPELRGLADEYPESSEIQFLVAETAYRLRLWNECVAYFRRGGEPDRPELGFYYAVALYESGDRPSAVEVLERTLPRLRQTDFIREYAARIRGAP